VNDGERVGVDSAWLEFGTGISSLSMASSVLGRVLASSCMRDMGAYRSLSGVKRFSREDTLSQFSTSAGATKS
jgi:hypothetical protein